jgi:hypothetical protein
MNSIAYQVHSYTGFRRIFFIKLMKKYSEEITNIEVNIRYKSCLIIIVEIIRS